MRRADLLASLRVAGYHNDLRTWMRLYTENRVSKSTADQAWVTGQVQRRKGMPCACHECKKTATKSTTTAGQPAATS